MQATSGAAFAERQDDGKINNWTMKEIRFGAIDIGSNAARLLITSVTGLDQKEPYFKKAALVRVPLRLGFDAFVHGRLSERSITRLTHTMQAYYHTMQAYEVFSYRACATSAMREAQNSPQIVEQVRAAAGLDIEILPGSSEARIIYNTGVTAQLDNDVAYLYIDVGGGSTEVSVFDKDEVIASRSFKIGTIRLLNGLVLPERWLEMEEWVKTHTAPYAGQLAGIGTGGNISKLHKIAKANSKKAPVSLSTLQGLYDELASLSLEARISRYDMKTDRADVIVPAADIFRKVMSWAQCQEVYVPKKGLADGITKLLYQDFLAMR